MSIETVLHWKPQPKQELFIHCPAREVVFGGARGGGKSDGVLGDWLFHSHHYGSNARALVVRKTLVQLDELIERAKEMYLPIGSTWVENKKSFRMPNGALMRMRYLEDESDSENYQGHSYTRLYPEELTNFTAFKPIGMLMATLRSAYGIPCQMKATCNPGGVGHNWVKERYITVAPPMTPYSDNEGKTYRVFIPSRLQDNPRLLESDPFYVENLKLAGTPELVRAWLEGDWDIVIGAFFPEFRQEKHVIPTRPIPAHWDVLFRAMDWGSAKPFCVLWFAISDGNTPPLWGRKIPRNALVAYRELYGWNGTPNQGIRMTADRVGRLIKSYDGDDEINIGYSKLDPSAFIVDGGPSIAETLARNGAWFNRGDNTRTARKTAVGGWDQIRMRLLGEDGVPLLYFMDCCRHVIRTLPTLPMDPVRFDDVDSESEDHPADTLRYGCMSRIIQIGPPAPVRDPLAVVSSPLIRPLSSFCLEDLWDTAPQADDGILRIY